MNDIIRLILCIFLPPIGVIDKGLAPILITLVLTLCGGIPGIISAFYFGFVRK